MFSCSWDGRPFVNNRHGSKIGGLCPFGEGEMGPHLTQCDQGLGLSFYQVASWSIQPFGHNRHGPKIGRLLCPLFGGGELGPHLTQCGLVRGLALNQIIPWSIQPFRHNRHGPRIIRTQAKPCARKFRNWGAVVPLSVGELGPHRIQWGRAEAYMRAVFHLDPSNRLATIHKRYRQDRTDRTTVR